MRKTGCTVVAAVVAATALVMTLESQLEAQGNPFTVISPVEGQSVAAGASVQLVLLPAAGLTVTEVQVWSPIGNYLQHGGTPILLSIPSDTLGPVALRILGQTSDGSRGAVIRSIQVTTGQTLNQITVSPTVVRLVAPGTTTGLGETQLTITGRYSDGVERDVSHLPQATIASDTASVATVDSSGLVTAVAPGQASISVTIGPIIGNARVQVNIFELNGDLDGDGDVDQDDLDILLRAVDTSATGPGDPRDLNNDGEIDALDAQILATLCSRPACATGVANLTGLSPAKVWVGLNSSDDVGLRLDLRAEVFVNTTKVGQGELDNVGSGSSGFNNAILSTIPLGLTGGPSPVASGDTLRVQVSARRTCFGAGHASGKARLWYNGQAVDSGTSRDAGSRFAATINALTSDYFLRSSSALSTTAGTVKTFADAFVNSTLPCPARPFTSFGTWSTTLP